LDTKEQIDYINQFKLRARSGQRKAHVHIELMLFMNLKASRLSYMSKLEEIKLKSSLSPLETLAEMTTQPNTMPPLPLASSSISPPISISSSSPSNSSYSSRQRLESSNTLASLTNCDRLDEPKSSNPINHQIIVQQIEQIEKDHLNVNEHYEEDNKHNSKQASSINSHTTIQFDQEAANQFSPLKFKSVDNLNITATLSKSSSTTASTNRIDQIKSNSIDNFSASASVEPSKHMEDVESANKKQSSSTQKLSKQAALVTDRLYNSSQLTKITNNAVVNLNTKQTGLKRKLVEKNINQKRLNQMINTNLLEKKQTALLIDFNDYNNDPERNFDSNTDAMTLSRSIATTSHSNEDERIKQSSIFSNNQINSINETNNSSISRHEVQIQNLIVAAKRNNSVDKINQSLSDNK
jgi:hypothetical protein